MTGLQSIRARLTAWYTLVLAVALAACGILSYEITRRQVSRGVDASLSIAANQLASTLSDEADESHGVLQARSASEVLAEFGDNARPMIVMTAEGRELAASASPLARSIDRAMLRRRIGTRAWGLSTAAGRPSIRVLVAPVRIAGAPYILAVGQSLADQERLLLQLRQSILFSIPLALLIAAGGGYLLARKSLAPVTEMSAKARAISGTSLDARIDVRNPRDELGQLAATLNELLARLEEAFASQRRFMADASHELRTPVAILQGEIDVALSRGDRSAAEYRESLAVMRNSVARLTRIVRDVFLLARSDTGQYPLRDESFYLEEVVAGTLREFRTLAAAQDVALQSELGHDIRIRGDEDLVQRLIGNLVDNAIRHTPSGGRVDVRCFTADDGARVEVTDGGTGIPAALHGRIFDRFFRAGGAEVSLTDRGGAGLGLPIARWIAGVHGGRLELARSDASGSTFVAVIPIRS